MSKTALIVLDVQSGVVQMVNGAFDIDQYVAKIASASAAARKAGVPVVQVTSTYSPILYSHLLIHISKPRRSYNLLQALILTPWVLIAGFRPSYADASPRNQMTARVKAAGMFKDTDASVQLHPAIADAAVDDIHIRKRRVSALYGTDLDVVLRSSGIEKIAVAGLATGGAVLSTVRQAFDMDYEVTVLADLCADSDPDVHEILLKKVLSKQASVVNADEWLALLRK